MNERASDNLSLTQASYRQLLQRFPGGPQTRKDGGVPCFVCSDLSTILIDYNGNINTTLSDFLHGDPYTLSEIGLEEDNITIVGNNLANGNEISVFINIETATTILTSENPESDDNTITLPEAIDIFQEVVSIASALLIDSFETEINY